MANYSLSRLERLYLQKQPTFGVIPGNPAGGDACRFIRMRLTNETAVIIRPDKTGSRSQTAGIKGRSFGRWTAEMSVAGNGTSGVEPDCDPLLVGLFGQDASVTGGVSVAYHFAEAIPLTTMWSYRQPAGLDQRVMHSCVVQEATFNLGQDGAATWSCQGEGAAMCTSLGFGSATLAEKGGLSSFPAEPGSPVTNGCIVAGFTGLVQIQSPGAHADTDPCSSGTPGSVETIAVIRTATVRVQTQNMLVKDTFGSYYPVLTEGGERTVQTAFSLYDSDDASTEAIKQATYDKIPVTIKYQLGTIPGNIWTFTLANVQLATFELNDQTLRFTMDVAESRSYSTNLTSADELTLVIT